MRRDMGFTLTETAIVLVIIGLLVGGVLRGQEMITQSKARRLAGEMEGIAAAVRSYEDRYKALPGDDRNAAARWPGTSSGDGDGTIQGAFNAAVPGTLTRQKGPESVFFWHHLRLAGLLPGSGADPPANSLGGKFGVQTGNGAGGGAVLAGAGTASVPGFSSLILCTDGLAYRIAVSLDAHMDDGIGTTGSVRAMEEKAPDVPVGARANEYADTGANQYVVCKQL